MLRTLTCILLLAAGQLGAQSLWQKLNPERLLSKNLRFIANPIIQNSPETGLKMGLAGNYFFKAGSDTLTRSSNIYLQIAYTTKNQFILEPIWNIFTPGEKYILRGRAGYLDFTDHFWGIGPTAAEFNKTDLSYNRIYLQNKILRRVRGNWFAGLNMRYSDIHALFWNENIPNVPGAEGSVVAGLGPNIQADFRDNPFSPQKGWYADVYYSYFGKFLRGQYTFDEWQFDLRGYIPTRKKHQVLALQAFANFTQGDIPFRELPRLGSAFLMRGFFEGRFRDFQYVAAQAEWRQPVWKWLHASAFLSAGEVAPSIRQLGLERIKVTGGAGLRILLNPKEYIFARLDFAFNNEGGTGVYIRINDAF